MFHQLTYRVGKARKQIKITAEQAKSIRDIMAMGDGGKFVTVGLETFQVRDIQNLSAEDTSTGKGAIRDLRRRLRAQADGCFTCHGSGFVDVLIGPDGKEVRFPGSHVEVQKAVCDCQARVKATAGLSPDDRDWFHKDDAGGE